MIVCWRISPDFVIGDVKFFLIHDFIERKKPPTPRALRVYSFGGHRSNSRTGGQRLQYQKAQHAAGLSGGRRLMSSGVLRRGGDSLRQRLPDGGTHAASRRITNRPAVDLPLPDRAACLRGWAEVEE